ncbi:TonB-dependent receptor [Belliella sp. DSM 111904]|uniref:TonB-dependent receptor n=1 Tax=Belliella filtrata TaxID=2923435 RepID=A0ABS9V494_9BACT|nr:TonB-dependent receptor [Belliella filtrata]MCH7411039.1 TonB-dependent receptor [Belliella filtrata]
MRKVLLLGLALLFVGASAFAQSRVVTGTVTSEEDGLPLPGVSILVKGTTLGTTTDLDGNYSINVPEGQANLIFSFMGFVAQELNIGNRSQVNLVLKPDSKLLGEVVVTGYGVQTKREVTGAIASVGAEDIKNLPLLGVDQALQGRAAGVQVTQSSGTPGAGISVRIRGTGSLNASSEPLYVIDGVPINTGSYTAIGAGGQLTNALSDLNPNDIESMEVLKDAAATAIYGSRGANGVVLITTKGGKAGSTRVDISHYSGIQQRQNDPVQKLTGSEQVSLFVDQVRNRFTNANGQVVGSGVTWRSAEDYATWLYSDAGFAVSNGLYQAVDNGDGVRDLSVFQNPATAVNNDWLSEIFRTAPIRQTDVAVSGGNDRTTFRISGTSFFQDGIQIGSGFERLNLRINLENKVSDKIKVGGNLGLSRSTALRPQNDNNINGVLSTAVLVANDIPIFRQDGTYYKDPGASTENPIAAGLEPFFESVSARVIGNGFVEYDIIPGLKFRSSIGIDYLSLKEDRFQPTTTNTGAGSNGLGQSSQRSDINWIWENTLNYSKSFGKNNVSAMLGYSQQESTYESLFAEATVFPGNTIRRLSAGSVKTEATSGGTSWALESYFSRFNYNFDERYLASFSIRADGSSRFGEDNRFGVFPAGSVGWRMSEEGFMSNIKNVISEFKWRASYGITGNQEIGNFASLTLFNVGANYNQLAGVQPNQLGNPGLSWERQEQYNIGADIGFLEDRIYLSAEYYSMDNNQLLLSRPLVGSSGFTGVQENIGVIRNRGWEFSLNTVNIDKRNFSWRTNFNITFNRNEVLQLAGNPFAAGFASWVEEGQPLGSFRGFRTEKIIQNAEDLAIARAQGQSAAQLGDIMFRDLNGDGVLNTNDQEILGSAQPKFFGGLTNTFQFGDFDIMAFLQFNYGNQIYNNTRSFSEGMNGVFGQTSGTLDRWTPENPSTTMPRAVHGDPNNNRRVSDRWIEDGSFMRLKNLSIGYNLPSSIANKVYARSIRVYASGQNLLTWTNYKGFDPEVSTFNITNTSPGTDFLTYPQARVYTLGVNVGF